MDWLREIFDRLLSVFPRILILGPYEAGLLITFGKRCTPLGPGWYPYWPLIQKEVHLEIQTQVVDLRSQSVHTCDGNSVVVSGAIQYSIRDVYKAICNVQDVDDSIQALVLGIILDYVSKRTLKECEDIELLRTEILKGLREETRGWGLKIEKVFITDLGTAINIRLLQ